METNSAPFVMFRRYPDYRVLPFNHPFVNNTRPVYIDKYDSPLKFSYNVAKQKSQIQSVDMPTQNYVVPKPLNDNISMSIEGTMLHNMPREIIDNQVSETKTVVDDNITETKEIVIHPQIGLKTRYTLEELLNIDISSDDDILEDIIPSGAISVLAGKGGVGKSMFYLQLSLCITHDVNEFIGKKITTKNKSVIIYATEDNDKTLAKRSKEQLSKIPPEVQLSKKLIFYTTAEDLFNTLRTELKLKRIDLIVLDALCDILKEDINSPISTRDFFNELEKLIREFDTTFLLIHHENKSANRSGRERILGSTAIVDRARSVFSLSKDNKTNIRTLTIEKSNNISDDKIGKPIKLIFDSESLTFSLAPEYVVSIDKDSETPKVAEYNEEQFAQTSPIEKSTTKIKKGKPGRKLDEEKVKQAIELSTQDYTLEEIGEIVGKHKTTICRWFKKYKGLC